jgi:hypothetical protein
VVPVGAHHDLTRVVRWFAGEAARGPGGETVTHTPHPYGVGLLVHADPARFFPAAEAQAAGEALDLALHDHWREANARAAALSPEARAVLREARAPSRPTPLAPGLRSLLADRRETFEQASPAGRLRDLRVPVMVLHGAEDPIVPPTEGLHLWPPSCRRARACSSAPRCATPRRRTRTCASSCRLCTSSPKCWEPPGDGGALTHLGSRACWLLMACASCGGGSASQREPEGSAAGAASEAGRGRAERHLLGGQPPGPGGSAHGPRGTGPRGAWRVGRGQRGACPQRP